MRLEKVKLGDVLEYEQPTNYIVDSVNYEDGFSIPVLTAGKSFVLGYTDEITGVFDNLPVIIFDDFTTAFHYVDFPFKVKSSAMKILKPVIERADLKYLYYKMQTISLDTDLHKRYWISTYSQLQITLPTLAQQQKIAKILDAADALRQNDKAMIAKYDELTQALFLDMFGDPVSNPKGWEKVELRNLCSFKKKSIKPEDITKGKNYVALDSIEKVTGNITTLYKADKGELKSNKFWFDSSYILYGKLRPYLNKVALPNFEGICSTDIIPIQPINKKSNKLFITSILRHNSFVAFADERSSGANLPRISPSEVEKYSTINPPIDLQNQFEERVILIEEQKVIAQMSLEKSDQLFNSLLQKAFKGELA